VWCIQAVIEGQQVPTFYLAESVQGIIGEAHAVQVAKDILLGSFHATRSSWSEVIDDSWQPDMSITAVRVGNEVRF